MTLPWAPLSVYRWCMAGALAPHTTPPSPTPPRPPTPRHHRSVRRQVSPRLGSVYDISIHFCRATCVRYKTWTLILVSVSFARVSCGLAVSTAAHNERFVRINADAISAYIRIYCDLIINYNWTRLLGVRTSQNICSFTVWGVKKNRFVGHDTIYKTLSFV